MVALLMLVFSPVLASFVSSAIAILLYTTGLARIAFKVGGTSVLAGLTVAAGALSGYAPMHLLNGLETGLAMAAVAWAVVFALEGRDTWHLPALCGAMPFVRPELTALSALLMAMRVWEQLRSRAPIAVIGRSIVVALLAALPWLLWARWDTGQFVPATMSAKTFYFAEAGQPAFIKILGLFAAANYMMIVVGFLGFLVIPRKPVGFALLAFYVAFMLAYYMKLPGGLYHNYHRYLQLLLPVSISMLVLSIEARALARNLLLIAGCWLLVTMPRAVSSHVASIEHTRTELAGLAAWSKANLPAGSRLLIHDAGYLAFATDFELVDMVGLKTPASIAYHEKFTGPSNGERRGDAIHEIALKFSPTHAVILNDGNAFWGRAESYLRQHGWRLEVLRPAPKMFGYTVFKLTPPN